MKFPTLQISLPKWVEDFIGTTDTVSTDIDHCMGIAIELSSQNILHRTGGPFGAVIFDSDTGRLIAPGVNLVTSTHCSNLHAEVVAITIAQQVTGSHDLSEAGNCQLVTSSEPCAMCMGAIYWSGVKKIIYGARDEDVRRIGFDEGIKPDNWQRRFGDMGIEVIADIQRQNAVKVLNDYASQGGSIYNPASK